MNTPVRCALCALFSLFLLQDLAAQGSSGVWVDAVPMTRRLFGANDASDIALSAGWSSNTTANGWRALIGFDTGKETQDNFGTLVTTSNHQVDVRAGRWWMKTADDAKSAVRLSWGIDAVFKLNNVAAHSENVDFSASNETTNTASGLSGVLGVQWDLAPGFHLVTEARLDALYTNETTRLWDSFSGEFKQQADGWNSNLNPPLQLLLVLDL